MADEKQRETQQRRKEINRLNRIIGHLEYIKRMLQNDEDRTDILIQIAAAKSALNGLGKVIISEHISDCIAESLDSGDTSKIEEFRRAVDKYL